MSAKRQKVVVAMSGGVDSSVAACLLVEQGYEVVGLFMRTGVKEPESAVACSQPASQGDSSRPPSKGGTKGGSSGAPDSPRAASSPARASSREHKGCCSASDASDARFVAGALGIPFYSLNFEREFDSLIEYFADEYARGRTPNPCVVCNDKLKFGRLIEYADAVGAKYIATGHYARVRGARLLRALDGRKDQSYVLFGLDRAILDRLLFPIGELTKPQVREIAERYGLPNSDKPDSVEICFVPDRDYARVVRERRPDVFAEGNVVNQAGEVIGSHRGIANYTIGQRRGLGVAVGRPVYVTNLDLRTNTVTLGEGDDLMAGELVADRVNYLIDAPTSPFRAEAKIRYLHTATPALVHPRPGQTAHVAFDTPQRAITPGQAVVFYDGDTVLGGGWIR